MGLLSQVRGGGYQAKILCSIIFLFLNTSKTQVN